MARIVEVARFENAIDAHRIADLLSDAGIEAEVEDENMATTLPLAAVTGVRVVVAGEDKDRAIAVIEADEAARRAEPVLDDSADPDEEDEAGEKKESSEDDG